jgi:hypothetical protein
MGFLAQYPGEEILLAHYSEGGDRHPPKVNNHIHTPFSFSAFDTIEEAIRMAVSEKISVLGINDFYVTDGYGEFIDRCLEHGIFPLLNVEMIGISKQLQEEGIRINDPNNPGRIYISGKGLAFPSQLPEHLKEKVSKVIGESNRQVSAMVTLLNSWLKDQGVELALSVDEIMHKLAMGLLRERHVVRMLRVKISDITQGERSYDEIMKRIYGGKDATTGPDDVAGMEDELRARLLKVGAPAFVPEDVEAFLPVEEILEIIRGAGGIPTYPLLLDGAGGSITEFEQVKEQLLGSLQEWGFRSVEFIPLRNRFEKLKEYAEYFYFNGFAVTFGTEHNTSARRPLTVSCRKGVALDEELMEISYRGAAFCAAHQYLVEHEGKDYALRTRDHMEQLGKAVISYFHPHTR